jgi:ligand-binding SRPBCC domain-containing protein
MIASQNRVFVALESRQVSVATEPIAFFYVLSEKRFMITISNMANMHRLESRQILPLSIEEAWDYFSEPANLPRITPPEMKFEITSPDIKPGTWPGKIVTYKVSPFPLMRSAWVTEITQAKEQKYFIDEQRFGPYRFWHHTHLFLPHNDGVEMIDQVYYKLPLGIFGRIANALFVRKKLKSIFHYRQQVLESLFETK